MEGLMKIGMNNVSDQIDDLDSFSKLLQNHIQSENSNAIEEFQVKLQERPWLRRLLPQTRFQREHESLTIQSMHEIFDNRKQVTNLLMNVMLEKLRLAGENHIISLKQKYEVTLMKEGIDLHAVLTQHCLEKREEMNEVLNKKMNNFNEAILIKEEQAERCKSVPHLYARVKKFIQFETSNFYDMSEDLLEKYKGLLSISLNENFKRLTQET
jgi:hypothetical protein